MHNQRRKMPARHEAPLGPNSQFADRLHATIDRWAARLSPELQPAFRQELRSFAVEYDRTLETIEGIWRRREQDYAVDPSTGLARWRHFLQHLVTLLGTPATPVFRAVGVVFIDLDKLKTINDTYGHLAGDRAIAATGAILREAVRVSRHVDVVDQPRDGDADYSASRRGGDEFTVVLELGDASEIDHVATRLKRNVDDADRQRAHGYDLPARLTASIGGVAYELPETPAPTPHQLARGLVTAADELMYESKHDGLVHLALAKYEDRLSIGHRYVAELSG